MQTIESEIESNPLVRPLRLPHLENGADSPRFLGEPLTPELAAGWDGGLWERCDGSRTAKHFTQEQRRRLVDWRGAGMLLLVPPPSRDDQAVGPAVISPHPDDAVLALGGLLASRGGMVLDVFSQETWTVRTYYRTRPELTTRVLIEEETAACRVLGAGVSLLGFTDGADRSAWEQGFLADRPGVPDPAEREPELLAELVDRLALVLPRDRTVYAPLGVGGHVDHVLCREAVLILLHRSVLRPEYVAFYEDMPYTLFGGAGEAVARLSGRLSDRGGLTPADLTVPEAGQAAKREALRAYRLQVTPATANRVDRYGRRAAATVDHAALERVWRIGAKGEFHG
jgi:LmbE family N-acetylglucosaminyl deacetylase